MRKVDDGDGDRGVVRVADRVADEFAVDLDFVEREALEVGEARITGAEIVHRQAHAEELELVQGFDGFPGVAHQQRFGQFQREQGGLDAALPQHLSHHVGQVLALELAGGEVDRDGQRGDAGLLPCPDLVAHALQHPFAHGHDQAGVLEDGDEFDGRDQRLAALPAQQRFESGDGAGGEADLGLEMQQEFLAVERAAQLQVELLAPDLPFVHLRQVILVAVAALFLGAIHRRIGVFEQLVRFVAVAGVEGDADAG